MRSVILTVIVLGVLVGAFAIFMSTQSSVAPPAKSDSARADKPDPATAEAPPATRNTGPLAPGTEDNAIGQGEDVWIQRYDKETGNLLSEFRAARYDPPVDGVVHVSRPESRFYMNNGQILVITARDGHVVMPEQTKKSEKMNQIRSQPPTRGTLHDVTLGLIETPDAPDPKDSEPVITCKLPIVAFDNDALRLNTVQTEIDGRIVPADRVPITVTGRYEFEGEGLIVRWNQRDRRLESLEVAHGKRLKILDTKGFGALPTAPAAGGAPRAALDAGAGMAGWARPLTLDGVIPIQLADADPAATVPMSAEEKDLRRRKRLAAARRAREQATTQRAPAEPVAYHATFADAVTVFEDTTPIGSADRMLATFTFEDEDDSDEAPATQPAAGAATQPATKHAAATRPAAARPPRPASTTAPASKPIEIRWTGKLTVVPKKFEESGLRSFKDRSIQFVGSPARLMREGSVIEAATILAASEASRFSARGSDQLGPVVLKDAAGTKLVSNGIDVAGDIVTIVGASTAEMVANDDKGQPQKLLAAWKEKGTLHLVTNARGERTIDSARLEGAVDVQHPQLSLKSDRLSLSFDPAGAGGGGGGGREPAIKAIDANGNVVAKISSGDARQEVTAKALVLTAAAQADGKMAFNRFKATGDVSLSDGKQKLLAQQVDATFKPFVAEAGKKSDVAIEKLVADGKVVFTGEAGATASADVVSIETAGAIQQVTLQGNPAQVADKESRLSGKLIRLASDGSTVSVVGAGTMQGLARASADAKAPQPVELSWSDSFDLDTTKNWAYAAGDVVITSKAADGTIDKAIGRRLTIALADAPKSPDTKAGDAKAEEAKPATAAAKKVLQSLTLSEGVEITSVLNADNDPAKPLRRVLLMAPGVTVGTLPDGSLGQVSIPTAGSMLYEDFRAADAAAQDAQASIRGAVAIEWAKSMTYDPTSRQVVLDGDVLVIHREPGKDPMSMKSQKLIAELQDGGDQQQQLKQVRAEGGATFASKQVSFKANDAVYDPVNNRIIARGTERERVDVYDENGVSSGSFEEVWWNLKDNRPERMKNVTGAVRR